MASERPKYMRVTGGPAVPWDVIEPHEAQALKNHDQTLQRLNERGGLSVREALSILSDRPWRFYEAMDERDCRRRLRELIDEDLRSQLTALRDRERRGRELLEEWCDSVDYIRTSREREDLRDRTRAHLADGAGSATDSE